jgi:hypothetical protein
LDRSEQEVFEKKKWLEVLAQNKCNYTTEECPQKPGLSEKERKKERKRKKTNNKNKS